MSGHPDHSHASPGRPLVLGIALNLGFVIVEAYFGWRSNSMALLSDAGHNLGDVLGLGLAGSAFLLARRKPSGTFTYGLGRSTILAAIFNGLLLVAAVGGLGWEAIRRLAIPMPVATGTVMAVAAAGILVNGATALLLHKGQHHDLNLRGAFLHMAMDALVSLGVVVAGLLMAFTGWSILDPLASLAIGALILLGTWSLLREAMKLILDAVPAGITLDEVRRHLGSDPRVKGVHDLHIWAMSTTETALSAHLVVEEGLAPDPFLAALGMELRQRFGIHHATIQLEHGDPDHPCGRCD